MIVAAGRVLAAETDLAPGHLVIDGDCIALVGGGIQAADSVFPDGVTVPGFIDLQVNGGVGVEVAPGRRADLTVLGGDGRARLTLVAGRTMFEQP